VRVSNLGSRRPIPYVSLDDLPPSLSMVRMPRLLDLGRMPAEELARIRTIFKRLTALRVDNPDDAEDLVQETFLTMAARSSEVDIEKSILIWGMGVLRRKVGNYYRRTQRRPGMELDALDPESPDAAWVGPSAESILHHAELEALLEEILADFPPRDRAVMELLVAGLPTSEIAEQLHPERYQNILNRAHRGRRRLLKALARYGYSPSGAPEPRRGPRARAFRISTRVAK
jgi:RNA polymerase sigma-70 factor (ECF subfamily)